MLHVAACLPGSPAISTWRRRSWISTRRVLGMTTPWSNPRARRLRPPSQAGLEGCFARDAWRRARLHILALLAAPMPACASITSCSAPTLPPVSKRRGSIGRCGVGPGRVTMPRSGSSSPYLRDVDGRQDDGPRRCRHLQSGGLRVLVVEESNTCVLDGLVVTRRGYSEGFRWVRSGVTAAPTGPFHGPLRGRVDRGIRPDEARGRALVAMSHHPRNAGSDYRSSARPASSTSGARECPVLFSPGLGGRDR